MLYIFLFMTTIDYRRKNYRKMPFPEIYDLYFMNTKLCGRVLKKPNRKTCFELSYGI
jgi:hypothetical protein